MNLTLISAALAFALGFGAAYKIQGVRIELADKQRSEIALEAERLVSRLESQRSAQNIAAQNNRALRESRLRADADAARGAAVSLRSALDAAVQTARADPVACADTALAISRLQLECSAAYGDLAATADRHVSDLQTLIDAWPR